MAIDIATPSPSPVRMRDLAKVVDAHNVGCKVQFLDDGSIANARWSDMIQRNYIVVRPSNLVVVAAREANAETDPTPYEVVWRGPHVATVTALDGDRVTYDTGYPPHRGVTKLLRDRRPAEERQPIEVGQQIVIFGIKDEPDAISLLDLAADGRPTHPDRLRTDWVARAQTALQNRPVP